MYVAGVTNGPTGLILHGQVGDRVFVSGNSSFSNNSGSYAQFVVTDATYVFPLHPRLSFAQVLLPASSETMSCYAVL